MIERLESLKNFDSNGLEKIFAKVKRDGKNKQYDCIIGVSGGVDSTYTAYIAREFRLRPLAVHLDNGWNSELAVKNIEHVLNKLNIDLYTKVLDWEEFRDLQLSFLFASTPDAEIPTDHAISATLYQTAVKVDVKYIISGTNIATEGVLPKSWTYGIYDWRYIKGVHKKHGKRRLRTYPHFTAKDRLINFFIRRLKVVCPLDYISYNKSEAIKLLKNKLEWTEYGIKHGESLYTKFFQSYILPKKFDIDKRKAHLSSLIVSGQITREEALEELNTDPEIGETEEHLHEYVLKKLDLSEKVFNTIMLKPPSSYKNFPNYEGFYNFLNPAVQLGKKLGIVPPSTGL
jgi:N-acetyl sugar amidotransferase